MNGPGPKQEGAALDVMDNLVVCKCRHSTAVHGMRGCYACECTENLHSLYTTNIAALRSRLSEQAALIDRLTRERDAMIKKLEWIDEFVVSVERKAKGLESLAESFREKKVNS